MHRPQTRLCPKPAKNLSASAPGAGTSTTDPAARHLEKQFVVADLRGQRLARAGFPKAAVVPDAHLHLRPAPQVQQLNDALVALHKMLQTVLGGIVGLAPCILLPATVPTWAARSAELTGDAWPMADKTEHCRHAALARPDFHQPAPFAWSAEHPPRSSTG